MSKTMIQKFFGKITKIGEIKKGMERKCPGVNVEITMTNRALDGSCEKVVFAANGILGDSVNEHPLPVAQTEKDTCSGVYMAEFKAPRFWFLAEDGELINMSKLRLILTIKNY